MKNKERRIYDDSVIVNACAAFIYDRAIKEKITSKCLRQNKYSWLSLTHRCGYRDKVFRETYKNNQNLHFEIQELVLRLLEVEEKTDTRVCEHFADPKRDKKRNTTMKSSKRSKRLVVSDSA